MQDDAQRLTAVEEKLAHLEKYLGELDEVVRDVAARLDVQAKGVHQVRTILEQHLAGGEDGDGASPDAERDRPPHW